MLHIKRTLALLFVLSFKHATMAQDDNFETAIEAVRNMRVGWNLGNTLDSNSGDTLNMWIEHWTNRQPSDYEKAWGQPVTKASLFEMLKDAGFNAVRIPVTWYPHMEAQFKFSSSNNSIWYPSNDDIGTKIKAAWMRRVHQVVDYVINQGMYCILNIHHDTGASNTAWLIADEDVYEQQRDRFEAVWTQIAEEFRGYDEHLLFEGYNEMLDIERSWCFASFAASGNYNASIASSAYNAINSYAQSFVNAVRATGGNNAQRNLIVSTYGACDGKGTWNSHLKDPLKQMKKPEDSVEGHLIFEVHSYPNLDNLSSAKNEVSTLISAWNSYLVKKGAPVIVGEWDSYKEQKPEEALDYARYFVQKTKAADIATFYWMGISDGQHRSVPEISDSELVDAIMKGYYGEEGYTAVIDERIDEESLVDVYSLTGTVLYKHVPRSIVNELPLHGFYIVGGKKMLK